MKENVINALARSTRSPRGKYAAEHTWKKLQKRMHPEKTLNYWYSRIAGIAALFALAIGVWAISLYIVPKFSSTPETVIEPQENATSETTVKPLVFQEMPLGQIVQRLEQTYHVSMQVEGEKLKSFRITATFQTDEKLSDILEILKQTAHCKVKKNGNAIILYLP